MSEAGRGLRLLVEILLVLMATELGIMLLLPVLVPGLDGSAEALLDASLLASIASPFIFWRAGVAMRPAAAPAKAPAAAQSSSRRRAMALALGMQVLGLSLTGGLVYWKLEDRESELQADHEWRITRLSQEIERRFTQPLYGLRGLAATYASTGGLSHAEFRRWVLARNLQTEFPGIRGLGFIEPVARKDLARYLQEARRDVGPDFNVRTQGDADDLFIIRHIEPVENNRAAWGFDIGSEARRRYAAEQAMATGIPTLTERIELVQDSSKTPGFLYLLPVYRNAQRQPDNLLGLVYVPIVAKELLDNTTAVAADMVDFALYDGTPSEQTLVFRSTPSAHTGTAITTTYLSIGGRSMTVRFWDSPVGALSHGQDSTLIVICLVGAIASTFLAGGIWLLSMSQQRAQRMAQRMTRDIERLARVASHTQDAVVMMDPRGHIDWVNQAFMDRWANPQVSVHGQALTELLQLTRCAPGAVAELRGFIDQAAAGKAVLEYPTRNGSTRFLETQITPFHADDGSLAGFIGVGSDITDIKRVQRHLEEAIRSSEALLKTVEMHAIVSFADRQGTIVDINASFCAISGYAPEELIGQNHRIVNSGVHPAAFWSDMWTTIASGKPWRGEICNRRKDGSLYWVDSMIAPFIGADGLVEKYVSIRTDITQRKAGEAALVLATQRLELAVEGGNEGLWDWMDLNRDTQWWSPSYYRLLGYTPEELPASSSNYVALLHPDSLEHSRLATESALAGTSEFSIEVQMRTASGAYRWFSTRAKVFRDASGVPQRMAGVAMDITDRRLAQEQLQQAMHEAQAATVAKGQFLANMSHELRTPMNAVLGMLTLMDNTELTVQQEDYVRKSRNAAQALLSILNDILDLSKVEAGKMELDPQVTHFEQLLQDLSVILSASVGKKPVEILFDVDPRLPEAILVDANRLRQVLINLAGNAVKFTERGEIVVRLALQSATDSQVRIAFSVSDTGIGISPQQQRKLFQAFSQAEASTTRRFGGTGLGLAISQQLVQLMGGEIGVDSVPGQGSRFHFELELPVVAGTPSAPDPAATALRVLLVEDNRVARELTQAMCQTNGWDCTAVASGEEALELFDRHPQTPPVFDAVLMDWNLPGMDGWQTVARLRALMPAPPGGQQTIVMVSAVARKNLEEISTVEQQLVDGYLVKPVTAHMLHNAVHKRAEGLHRLRTRSRPGSSRPLAGLNILVVEDNLINQQVAEELLSAKGARVSLAANGQLGVQAIAAAKPQFDLVLMDVQMPVMDGYAATACVRNQLQLHSLPIVAMTANAMATDRSDCLAAGMNEHVGKPFDLQRLTALILRLTGRSASTEAPESLPAPGAGTEAGIDIDTALARMGGQRELFLRSARDFQAQLPQQVPMLQRSLADGDLAQARMHLHTLKGTSALVGCFALSREAARLEALAHGADSAALQAAVPALADVLRDTGSALAAALPPLAPQADAPPAAGGHTQELDATLRELQALLQAEDFVALERFAALRDTLAGWPARDALEQALQALDFAQAHALVHAALQDARP